MCGIAGVAGFSLEEVTVLSQVGLLRHRGPDSFGVHRGSAAMVAQSRLAIIDLVTGDPPITDESGTIGVAFNGEIYNFRDLQRNLRERGHDLKTDGDTEVIAHLAEDHEPEALCRRLDGMFAFALWDEPRRRLVLARDRLGKKPLYYWEGPGGDIVFASEIKAVLADPRVPRRLAPEAVDAYLAFGYVPSPHTFFEGVRSVPPGHVLVAAGGSTELHPYWAPQAQDSGRQGGAPLRFQDAAAEVRSLLRDAVGKRLVADVPLGAFLSGGVDSSAIVALMADLSSRPVKTFTIGFEDDEGYDERPYARQISRLFGTEHTEFVVNPDKAELIERLVWHHDQPFGDSSALPTFLLSELTRRHVTVALSGDGGDELFGGYERFPAALAVNALQRLPRRLPAAAGWAADRVPPTLFGGRARSVRRLLERADTGLPRALLAWVGYLSPEWQERLRPCRSRWGEEDYDRIWAETETEGAATLDRLLLLNLRTYLLDDLLPKADRMSMAHGLEVRSPLLDDALVDLAFRLPPAFKVRGWSRKRVLKEAVRDVVPHELLHRRKRGFGVPLDRWFREELRAYAEGMLTGPEARVGALLEADPVRTLVAEHMAGGANHGQGIWTLLTLEVFLRQEGWQVCRPPRSASRLVHRGAPRPCRLTSIAPEGRSGRRPCWPEMDDDEEPVTEPRGPNEAALPSATRLLLSEAKGHVVAIAGLGMIAGAGEATVLLLIVRSALAATTGSEGQLVGLPVIGKLSLTAAGLVGIGVLLVRLLAQLGGAWISADAFATVRLRWLDKLVERSLKSRWEDVSDQPEGTLSELASAVVRQAATALLNLALAVQQAATLIILLVATLFVNAVAAVAALASVAVLSFLIRPIGRLIRRQATRSIEAEQQLATRIAEVARSLLEVRSVGVEAEVSKGLMASAGATAHIWRRVTFGKEAANAVYQAAALGIILGGIAVVSRGGPDRLASLGTIVLMLIRAFAYSQQLQAEVASLQAAGPAVLRVDEALRALPLVAEDRKRGAAVPRPLRELRLRGVGYWYQPDQAVLQELDLVVGGAEMVGLRGPSGTGKTTLLHLLLGLRAPRAGSFEVNGVDVSTISARAWKAAVGFVPQEPMLVAGTIADNIRFFRDGLSDDQVREAAMRAGLGPDLAAWPEGLSRLVGQRRHGVSGGQRQRITIARALAGDPIVLLMDEPTSSLDEEAEGVVLETLRGLKGQLTVIVAAHRPSILNLCDRVVELQRSGAGAEQEPAAAAGPGAPSGGRGSAGG